MKRKKWDIGSPPILCKPKVYRNHIGNQVSSLRIMPIPEFQHIQRQKEAV